MPLPTGSRLGPYEIEAPLGAGGMGEVYRARDSRLGRVVALKVLPTELSATPSLRERFGREARAISAVEHPNICALYDVGEEGGVDYLVMQLVEGETLAARLERGPIPPLEACGLARQIALALEAAHERGIVHRDLKPSNIQLARDGQVKLLDFGLARILAPATADVAQSTEPTLAAPTRAGTILGTAPYMSPEQARGHSVDRRTDVWAFGCVLYEMLGGQRAFGGASAADVLAAVMGQDPDWSRLPAATPRRVRDLLRRCLQKDVARRLRDVGDARLELEDATASDPGATDPTSSPTVRSPWLLLAWGIAGLALAVAAFALARPRPGPADRRAAMRFSTVTNFSGVEAQPSFSPDGRSIAYISNRGGRWDVYVGLITGGTPVRITDDPSFELFPRWSPDGSRLLFQRLNEKGLFDVWVVPALGGDARRIISSAVQPAWSPDGKEIAYSSGGALWICDANGARARALTRSDPPLAHYRPAFSRGGRWLAFVQRRDGPYSELGVVDRASGAVRSLTSDRALALSPVWSPDDRFIYFTSSRGGMLNVWKVAVASGELQQITVGRGDDMEIDLSADGSRLVFSSYRANPNLAELSLEAAGTSPLKWLTADAARGESGPRYSPDGRFIAYFSNRVGAERETVWVMDAGGGNPRQLVQDENVNVHPRWTADGRQLVYYSRNAGFSYSTRELRRIAIAGGAPEALPIQVGSSFWGDVAPDGRILCRVSTNAGEIVDPRRPERVPVADLPGEPSWSRDGRLFAYVARPELGESSAGLWIGSVGGPRHRLFPGWVSWFAWSGPDALLVAQPAPDLSSVLWRVRTDGQREAVLSVVSLPWRPHMDGPLAFRFDVHPDGRRIAFEALESFEADISMIENVQ